MRVLVLLSNNTKDGYLIKLHTKELVREVNKYLATRNNSQAMVTAIVKGKIEREVRHDEAHLVSADLVLRNNRVCWDLTKQK
ncbi:MAG: hypothetical protein JXB40_00585 [Candidatus Omnitrophica bacterium]|nr:hypothetical protein [Candidatus Omnitrophota bacterium]